MIKILTYIDNKKDQTFSRSNKNKDKESDRIFAETELDELLKDGWTIVSASTSDFVTGALTAVTSFARLTVILQKND